MTESSHTPIKKLGTFAGVFTPSILTILGIILFRRLGFVVGSAGLAKALVIMALANLISVLTSYSLAAIATNMKVKGGGDYYLISRTLGVEFGGAIGLVLFLAQSVSIGFYCIGFGEAVQEIAAVRGLVLSPQAVALCALLFLFILAWVGADLATKFQFLVMALLTAALVSFYLGGIQNWDSALLVQNWSTPAGGAGFWVLFAIFFPAVTGFTQGVSMSGDLADAGKSLPAGTLAAVAVSILVYVSVAVIFSASAPLDSLAADYGVMARTAAWGGLIDAGVVSATLSSAMASFLGAPRILQSLSKDQIFKILNPFAKGTGPSDNPRRGVLMSLAISVLVIALGQLDLIAGIVSMFFLISYGLLNYATFFEAAAQSPSFRPRFRFYHRYISLAGFLCCSGVMMAIDLKTGIAAVSVMAAIYHYLKRSQGPARWADSQRSHHLQQIRKNLLAAQKEIRHPREWRPILLALSGSQEDLTRLMDFSRLIEAQSGMTTIVRLIPAGGYRGSRLKSKHGDELKKALSDRERSAFPLVVSAPDTESALSVLLQSFGIGPVRANTVLAVWDSPGTGQEREKEIADPTPHLRQVLQAGCNLILFHCKGDLKKAEPDVPGQIHVWWNGDDSSRLALLLAYLVTRSPGWQESEIHLLAVHYDRENKAVKAELAQVLDEIRIPARPRIILGLDEQTMLSASGPADLVFLPVILEKNRPIAFSRIDPEAVLPGLAAAALVTAATPMDLDPDPEEGEELSPTPVSKS